MEIEEDLIPLLDEMLYELYENRLEVCLVPGNNPEVVADGRMIRVAFSKNPEWYQKLCQSYPSVRERKNYKNDTRIKRQYILNILERMIRNKKSKSKYAEFLLNVVKDRKKIYDQLEALENTNNIPWDNQF